MLHRSAALVLTLTTCHARAGACLGSASPVSEPEERDIFGNGTDGGSLGSGRDQPHGPDQPLRQSASMRRNAALGCH